MKIKNFFKSKFFIALLAGIFCSLAFAPFHFFVAAVVSLSIFYSLLERESQRKTIFWLGFAYGFGYFLSGIYWIAISLLVDADKFSWLIPFALTLIPSALALYLALFAVSYKTLVRRLKLEETYKKILVFTLCWLIFEVLRSILFTGFPWNLLGYVWMFDVTFAQLASIFGIYGLTVFAVLTCLFPVLFFKPLGKKPLSEISSGDEILGAILTLFLIGNLIYGTSHIDNKKLVHDHENRLRLVQGNIKQEMKWDASQKYKNFLKHIELTNSQDLSGIKAVIWSETSVPYVVDHSAELMGNLKSAVPINGSLITGGIRLQQQDGENNFNVWNSIFIVDENGVIDFYDKHHLVPFGEYVPLQKYLPFIEKITDGAVGFSEGKGAKTIVAKGLSFSPLVCYEVIFSNEVINRKFRPELLLNLTNDAWFGTSSGPYQHFDMAKMRSIEYGISLARVANTGITAFVDPFGRVVEKINLNQTGIIDVDLIKPLPPTIYENYGYLFLILLILPILLLLLFNHLNQSPKTKKPHVTRQNHPGR